ncbi:hypothetical protein [Curtobacterium sp. MCBD17_013]|uniref:hypothetical protein n=1 Tax=Curtobacterium sp. MCBD17_013 TaxID=2175668 RepID=UPI0011B5F144|nr:hypothetical protein [Curtobacterium sp. MCBD17_013]
MHIKEPVADVGGARFRAELNAADGHSASCSSLLTRGGVDESLPDGLRCAVEHRDEPQPRARLTG